MLKSIDNDGPDTEEAVFAIHARQKQETEQLAYDEHHLTGQLKRQLTAFVAIAAKVDFSAQTVEKNEDALREPGVPSGRERCGKPASAPARLPPPPH